MSNEEADNLKHMFEKIKDVVADAVKDLDKNEDWKSNWSDNENKKTKASWEDLELAPLLDEMLNKANSEIKNIVNEVDEEIKQESEKRIKTKQWTPTYKFALREDLKNDKRFLPTKAHESDTGWDVRVATKDHNDLVLHEGDKVMIPLGFRAMCPEGWWLKLNPRSSTFVKKHLNCLYGIVDSDYTGFLYLCVQFQPPTDYDISSTGYKQITLPFGDKIGQLVPVRREEMIVEEISNEEFDTLCSNSENTRGNGGFGSSGN